MKCMECGATLKYENGGIFCSRCDYYLELGDNLDDDMENLVLSNINADKAFEEGRFSYIADQDFDNNPYPGELVLERMRWRDGYEFEQGIQEAKAASIAKSMEDKELRGTISSLEDRNRVLDSRLNSIRSSIDLFFRLIENAPIFFKGKFYFREIEMFKKEINRKIKGKENDTKK